MHLIHRDPNWRLSGVLKYEQCKKCGARRVTNHGPWEYGGGVKMGWPSLTDSHNVIRISSGWIPEPPDGWPAGEQPVVVNHGPITDYDEGGTVAVPPPDLPRSMLHKTTYDDEPERIKVNPQERLDEEDDGAEGTVLGNAALERLAEVPLIEPGINTAREAILDDSYLATTVLLRIFDRLIAGHKVSLADIVSYVAQAQEARG